MTRSTSLLFYWLPPTLWMFFLFPLNPLLTSGRTSSVFTPLILWLVPAAAPETIDALHAYARKAGHFFAYAILAYLLYRAFRRGRTVFSATWILFAGVISLGYGALDEYLQVRIPTRTGSLSDWIIDSLGVAVCTVIVLARTSYRRRSRRNAAGVSRSRADS